MIRIRENREKKTKKIELRVREDVESECSGVSELRKEKKADDDETVARQR